MRHHGLAGSGIGPEGSSPPVHVPRPPADDPVLLVVRQPDVAREPSAAARASGPGPDMAEGAAAGQGVLGRDRTRDAADGVTGGVGRTAKELGAAGAAAGRVLMLSCMNETESGVDEAGVELMGVAEAPHIVDDGDDGGRGDGADAGDRSPAWHAGILGGQAAGGWPVEVDLAFRAERLARDRPPCQVDTGRPVGAPAKRTSPGMRMERPGTCPRASPNWSHPRVEVHRPVEVGDGDGDGVADSTRGPR